MSQPNSGVNAGILDVLYAVALGEGFLWAVSAIRDDLGSGAFATPADLAQIVCRAVLAFMVIMLSWAYYRSAMLPRREYAIAEFVVDVVTMMLYLVLFQLIDAPLAYYTVIATLWVLYWLARSADWLRSPIYLAVGLGFVLFFAAVALSARIFPGPTAEWFRLAAVAVAACLYRPLDRRCAPRIPLIDEVPQPLPPSG